MTKMEDIELTFDVHPCGHIEVFHVSFEQQIMARIFPLTKCGKRGCDYKVWKRNP